ncbi:MAG: thioredoxin-disulfide reductase [Candidatus Omnitrophica bacterium]|nr:thioredoxin-disulfide reductase [Candidatus Omnitrophota bacterium]
MENVIIIGSGPAGHTAAIYTSRANLNPLMLEGMFAGGVAAGGQLTTTTEIENFPGFPEGISGPELMQTMREQSVKCGCRIETLTVDKVDFSAHPFKIFAGSQMYESKTVIIATGATAKKIEIQNGDRLWQRGISACAVCDGALPCFRNKPLIVIGGGDSAVEEATYLTKFAAKVYLVVRRDVLRASQVMRQRALANPKIEILWNSNVTEALGEKMFSGAVILNNQTQATRIVDASGLFFAIGHAPNTAFLNGQLKTDETGYIMTLPGTTQTNLPGVFACGDVQDKKYRQAITAAGSGCMAALNVEQYLHEIG